MDHPARGRTITAQQGQQLVMGATAVQDQRQVKRSGQLKLRLQKTQLQIHGHLDARIQPALANGHQTRRRARQPPLQLYQCRFLFGQQEPGMQPQGVEQPVMLLMQLWQHRPLRRGDGGHNPARHPRLTAARQHLR